MKKKNPFISNPLIGLYTVWTVFWFISWYLFLYPFIFPLLHSRKTRVYATRLVRVWSNLFFWFGFIRFNVRYHVKPDPKAVYVVCSNHFSYLDIPALVKLVPNYASFVGKNAMKKIPLFGYMYARLNILVDRGDNNSRASSLGRSIRALQANRSILIFPEGGIVSKQFPFMGNPLKDGAFVMAIQQQVPILPISFFNNYELLDDNTFVLKPGTLHAEIHAPIETKGLTQEDVPMLRDKVYQLIQKPILDFHGLEFPH